METPLPCTELGQMGLGINSAFVQLLTGRRKLLRQARLEPAASGSHSAASFHWNKAEYLPWSTLSMLILLWSFWPASEPIVWWSKADLCPQCWTFSVQSCILKPHFDSWQNMFHYCHTCPWKRKGLQEDIFSGRMLNWKLWLQCFIEMQWIQYKVFIFYLYK